MFKLLRNLLLLSFVLCAVACSTPQKNTLTEAQLQEALTTLPRVETVTPKESRYYAQKYEMYIRQPLSHADTSKGWFNQRFFVYHVGYDRPTVMITEGYNADRYDNASTPCALSVLLGANVVAVEHRYFSKSCPEEVNWDYLTVENSANDLHNIYEALKTVYSKKWMATGISKGGQTSLIYSTWFPNDMACWVPYVGPLCSSAADPGPITLLDQMGTKEEQDKIIAFQRELLKRKASMVPMVKERFDREGLKFRVSYEELFENMVLEYAFALRQYNETLESMPTLDADDKVMFNHFINKVGIDFYRTDSWNGTFFVQAAHELGFYSYNMEPFKDLMSSTEEQVRDYVSRIHVPDGVNYKFDPSAYNKMCDYINNSDPNIIFIYGELDPWTGAMPKIPTGKKNMRLYNIPGKVHSASVTDLPQDVRIEVVTQIKKWLEIE